MKLEDPREKEMRRPKKELHQQIGDGSHEFLNHTYYGEAYNVSNRKHCPEEASLKKWK